MSKGKSGGLKGLGKNGQAQPPHSAAPKPSMPTPPKMVQRKASQRGR